MASRTPILWLFVRPMMERVRGGCANGGAQHSLTVWDDAVMGDDGDEGTRYGLK